jgi:hypothetical protein
MTKIVGTDAVLHARRHWPDLLPELHPVVVRAPQPPMLDPAWSDQHRLDFLVEAYLSFGQLHCPPAAWQRLRVMAMAARKGGGRCAADRAKLVEAGRIMAGLGWGELEDLILGGKLPREIAPHSWLAWSVGTLPSQAGFPVIGSVFSPGRLLQVKNLRIYSHTAQDLSVLATRHGEQLGRREGIGQAYTALKARERAVFALGFADRFDCQTATAAVGAGLGGQDLRQLHAEEKARASQIELRLARLAEAGTWVWGICLQPKVQQVGAVA